MDTKDNRPGQGLARTSASVTPSPAKSSMISREAAGRLVSRLMDGYPLQLPNNPEGYYANIITILCEYSQPVAEAAINHVLDHGGNYLPSRFQVREALRSASLNGGLSYGQLWDRRAQAQLEERDRLEGIEPPKQTIEQVREEMRARGLAMPVHRLGDRPHTETPDAVRKRHGLSQEEWDAIPDAK
jgi:hypothetical protein